MSPDDLTILPGEVIIAREFISRLVVAIVAHYRQIDGVKRLAGEAKE